VDLQAAIHTQGLRKAYKRRLRQPGLWGAVKGFFHSTYSEMAAVKGLDLKVKRGERVGLIGENGAGKSTTVKMLTGILLPTSGELRVLGLDPWKQRRELAKRIGVVFGQRPQLMWDIPVRETFSLLKDIYQVPDARFAMTLATCTKLLELEPLMGVPVRQLSLGQRMRCDLAAAVLHGPELAFLDEPTIGLDVLARQQARELIKWLSREFGTTLILTTHDLKDITETCQRVVLLDKGGLLFDGSLKAFERRFAPERVVIADYEKQPLPAKRRVLDKRLAALACQALWKAKRLHVTAPSQSAMTQATKAIMAAGPLEDLNFERAEIERIVRDIYVSSESRL
jgi:ABC-2 type transport system ATP-binding protein